MAECTPPNVAKRDEYCCVPMCNGNARLHKELSFHHFPSLHLNPELRKRWIIAIRRDEGPLFKIGSNTVVCSRHFKKDDFRTTFVRKCLKPGSVPSIFKWMFETPRRKPPTKRQLLMPHKKLLAEENIQETEDILEDFVDKENQLPEHQGINEIDIHTECKTRVDFFESSLRQKEDELKRKNEEIEQLIKQLALEKFGINRFSTDDSMIEFYTGFPTYSVFLAFYGSIKPSKMRNPYYTPSDDVNGKGRPKALLPIDELFMFLCRLKSGFLTEDLAVRFNIHKSTVSRLNIMWTNYLYFLLGGINIWPRREKILEHMPTDFKTLAPKTRVIIDCTEIFTERPSSLALSSKTFSSYKSHNTWKGLVGIAPNGAVTFISSLYSGCMSDIEITKRSGLLDLMEPGDEIMADKGFVLDKLLKDTGVSVVTPHFLCSDGQFTSSQIADNQKIASLRIHVERHIKRVKEYRLLQSTVPLSIAGSVNQLWTIANVLTLFRRPLIKLKN